MRNSHAQAVLAIFNDPNNFTQLSPTSKQINKNGLEALRKLGHDKVAGSQCSCVKQGK